MNKKYQIAIDGFSGVGKSTIARNLAYKLNFVYVNTGLLFRAIAYYFLENKIENYQVGLQKFSQLNLVYQNDKIIVNNEDWSLKIKSDVVSQKSSQIAVDKDVRQYILKLEHEIAKKNDVIMEGRDIGSIVLPNANLKVFLTASARVRARRRYQELQDKNLLTVNDTLESIEKNIEARDKADMEREIAPLVVAKNAILINTDDRSIFDLVELIAQLFEQKIKTKN